MITKHIYITWWHGDESFQKIILCDISKIKAELIFVVGVSICSLAAAAGLEVPAWRLPELTGTRCPAQRQIISVWPDTAGLAKQVEDSAQSQSGLVNPLGKGSFLGMCGSRATLWSPITLLLMLWFTHGIRAQGTVGWTGVVYQVTMGEGSSVWWREPNWKIISMYLGNAHDWLKAFQLWLVESFLTSLEPWLNALISPTSLGLLDLGELCWKDNRYSIVLHFKFCYTYIEANWKHFLLYWRPA